MSALKLQIPKRIILKNCLVFLLLLITYYLLLITNNVSAQTQKLNTYCQQTASLPAPPDNPNPTFTEPGFNDKQPNGQENAIINSGNLVGGAYDRTGSGSVTITSATLPYAKGIADYLEGNFQDEPHRLTDLRNLTPVGFQHFNGPAVELLPQVVLDVKRMIYVSKILNQVDSANNTKLEEAVFDFTDVCGQNPRSISDLFSAYDYPVAPSVSFYKKLPWVVSFCRLPCNSLADLVTSQVSASVSVFGLTEEGGREYDWKVCTISCVTDLAPTTGIVSIENVSFSFSKNLPWQIEICFSGCLTDAAIAKVTVSGLPQGSFRWTACTLSCSGVGADPKPYNGNLSSNGSQVSLTADPVKWFETWQRYFPKIPTTANFHSQGCIKFVAPPTVSSNSCPTSSNNSNINVAVPDTFRLNNLSTIIQQLLVPKNLITGRFVLPPHRPGPPGFGNKIKFYDSADNLVSQASASPDGSETRVAGVFPFVGEIWTKLIGKGSAAFAGALPALAIKQDLTPEIIEQDALVISQASEDLPIHARFMGGIKNLTDKVQNSLYPKAAR